MAGRTVNIALQGGGAHGAFSWGVLDWMLESGAWEIEGLSGTTGRARRSRPIGGR